jgi:rsbT antagonist protein RsbS
VVPILRQGRYLIASIQAALTDTEMRVFKADLLERVGVERARGVVVDVGGLDVIDSYGARLLTDIAATLRLRGARMVVVGVRPEVAFSMVRFGLDMRRLDTVLDLEEALDFLDTAIRRSSNGG